MEQLLEWLRAEARHLRNGDRPLNPVFAATLDRWASEVEAATQSPSAGGSAAMQTYDPSRPWGAHQHSPGHWSVTREPLPGGGIEEYMLGTGNLSAHEAKRLAASANAATPSSAGGAVPAGMRMVPIDPTPEMFEAARCEFDRNFSDEYLTSGYRAMLAASPSLGAPAAPTDTQAETRKEVLSDIDPVVLEVWKIQGRKVGAMLREAQSAVEELQERLDDTPSPSDSEMLDWLEAQHFSLHASREPAGDDEITLWWQVVDRKKSISGHPLGNARDAIRAAMKEAKK